MHECVSNTFILVKAAVPAISHIRYIDPFIFGPTEFKYPICCCTRSYYDLIIGQIFPHHKYSKRNLTYVVTTAGRPSGIAATARATAIYASTRK